MADIKKYRSVADKIPPGFEKLAELMRRALGQESPDPLVSERLEMERRRAEHLAKPVTEEEMQDRRIQEQWMDTEYLADVEEQSRPMNEGRGSVFTALGYHGSPDSDEGQASISHYEGPMVTADGRRILGEYTPRVGDDMSQEEIDLALDFAHRNYSFYGDPPTVGGIAIDASSQLHGESPDPRGDYGDTLYHELKHGAFDSEAFQKLLKRPMFTIGKKQEAYRKAFISASPREQHAVFELIRQIEQGEVTYEELSEEDRERLDNFADVEKALSDSFTEKERLKMGIFERKAPVTPPNPSDPVEMPEGYRAGGRVRLI
tara:strand:+ start:562 stop:1515 length:954 start_codon:yes stop_codon:yes gene_type:complete